jgi:hypothetical protein
VVSARLKHTTTLCYLRDVSIGPSSKGVGTWDAPPSLLYTIIPRGRLACPEHQALSQKRHLLPSSEPPEISASLGHSERSLVPFGMLEDPPQVSSESSTSGQDPDSSWTPILSAAKGGLEAVELPISRTLRHWRAGLASRAYSSHVPTSV